MYWRVGSYARVPHSSPLRHLIKQIQKKLFLFYIENFLRVRDYMAHFELYVYPQQQCESLGIIIQK